MCSCSPHILLKFGEIRFINHGFITEKPRVAHFPPKILVAPVPKLGLDPETVLCRKNGTDVLYPHAKFGGDQFAHGDAKKENKRVFVFLFLLLAEILRKFLLVGWSVAFVCLSPLYRWHFKGDLHQTLPGSSPDARNEVINFWEK